jgi:hypothetical protein
MGRFFLLPGFRLPLDFDFLARAIIHLLVAVPLFWSGVK